MHIASNTWVSAYQRLRTDFPRFWLVSSPHPNNYKCKWIDIKNEEKPKIYQTDFELL